MNRSEPSSSGRHSSSLERSLAPFLIGRDSHGFWVAERQDGKSGGLFVDRAAAIHFAMAENGRHAEDIVIVAGVLELDTHDVAQKRAA